MLADMAGIGNRRGIAPSVCCKIGSRPEGQDILFEALDSPMWENRDWHLSLYGEGPIRDPLQTLAVRLGISNRVTFAGHVNSVEEIWMAVVPWLCHRAMKGCR